MEDRDCHREREASAALVERVTYYNVENGFCVLRAKARGHRDLWWATPQQSRPASGSQRPTNGSTTAPTASSSRRASCAPLLRLLSSGMIRGVGPV
jgi:exodeoxyribonuclease V alpha subunit